MTLDQFFALPTWMITNSITPFLPESHPWCGRRFGLATWAAKETVLCRAFDAVAWVSVVLILLPFT